jgi:hypothetical protein
LEQQQVVVSLLLAHNKFSMVLFVFVVPARADPVPILLNPKATGFAGAGTTTYPICP